MPEIKTIKMTGHLNAKTYVKQGKQEGLLYEFPRRQEITVDAYTIYTTTAVEDVGRFSKGKQSIEECLLDLESWADKNLESSSPRMLKSEGMPRFFDNSLVKPEFFGKEILNPVPEEEEIFFPECKPSLTQLHNAYGQITLEVSKRQGGGVKIETITQYSIRSKHDLDKMISNVRALIPIYEQNPSLFSKMAL